MRPLSASKRSASIATLLTLGSAATSTMATNAVDDSDRPASMQTVPMTYTISECTISLTMTTGR